MASQKLAFTTLRHKKAFTAGHIRRPYLRVCNNGHCPNIYLVNSPVPTLYPPTDTLRSLLRGWNSTGKLLHETKKAILADYELVCVTLDFSVGDNQGTEADPFQDGIF